MQRLSLLAIRRGAFLTDICFRIRSSFSNQPTLIQTFAVASRRFASSHHESNQLGTPFLKVDTKLALGFTCKPCGHRTNRLISKHSYNKGVVLVRCSNCKSVHLIADHIGWFKGLAPGTRTIEEIAAARGESVRKQLEADEVFEVGDFAPESSGGPTTAFSCTVKPDSESDLEMSSDVQWEYAPDKTFKRQILRKGSGLVCPRDGSVCKIRIAPSDSTSPNFILQRSIVLRENLDNLKEVVVGENDTEFDNMLDKVLEHMKPEEKSLVSFNIHEEEQISVENLSTNASVVPVSMYLELIQFQEVPEVWELNVAQLVDCARHHKERGVSWYKSQNYMYALRRFVRAMRTLLVVDKEVLKNLAAENDDAAQLFDEYRRLTVDLYTNIAAIQLISKNYKSVVENCTKALTISPDNIKARYRRGVAYARTNERDCAMKDLSAALQLAPNDSNIRNELRALTNSRSL